MTIYEHRDSVTAASGSTSTVTLNCPGGLLRNVLVIANTATTEFKANLVDSNDTTRVRFGLTTCELNYDLAFPFTGKFTLNITNASPDDDTFNVVLGIQER